MENGFVIDLSADGEPNEEEQPDSTVDQPPAQANGDQQPDDESLMLYQRPRDILNVFCINLGGFSMPFLLSIHDGEEIIRRFLVSPPNYLPMAYNQGSNHMNTFGAPRAAQNNSFQNGPRIGSPAPYVPYGLHAQGVPAPAHMRPPVGYRSGANNPIFWHGPYPGQPPMQRFSGPPIRFNHPNSNLQSNCSSETANGNNNPIGLNRPSTSNQSNSTTISTSNSPGAPTGRPQVAAPSSSPNNPNGSNVRSQSSGPPPPYSPPQRYPMPWPNNLTRPPLAHSQQVRNNLAYQPRWSHPLPLPHASVTRPPNGPRPAWCPYNHFGYIGPSDEPSGSRLMQPEGLPRMSIPFYMGAGDPLLYPDSMFEQAARIVGSSSNRVQNESHQNTGLSQSTTNAREPEREEEGNLVIDEDRCLEENDNTDKNE